MSEVRDCELFQDSLTHWLEGALSPAGSLRMERHRSTCRDCRELVAQMRLMIGWLGRLGQDEAPDPQLPRLLALYRERLDSLRSPRAARGPGRSASDWNQLEELRAQAPSQRRLALRNRRRCRSPVLAALAVEEARRLGVRQPREALELAELGVEICAAIAERGEDQSPAAAHDRLAIAWATLGNARRICSDLAGAAEAFRVAEDCLQLGANSTYPRAQFLQLRAAFFADTGSSARALNDYDEALTIHREENDSHQEARVLIGKGKLLGSLGALRESISLLRQGLEALPSNKEPRLELVAKHNLLQYLFECGEEQQAELLMKETRELHSSHSNSVDLMRFQWLEGKIALDGGDLATAERTLTEVKMYFVELGIAYDAALVSLDLAMVFLQQGRAAELKALAGEMVTIFRALGIRRETFAALAFFNKALEIETTATAGLLQELSEVLEVARQREDFRHHLAVSS